LECSAIEGGGGGGGGEEEEEEEEEEDDDDDTRSIRAEREFKPPATII
jgi:hypothetical protein